MIFSADDICDIGTENGALVTADYPQPLAFNGDVNWVEIAVVDDFLSSDELLRVAIARQ